MTPFDPSAPLEGPEPRTMSDVEVKILSAYETVFSLGSAQSVQIVLDDLERFCKIRMTVYPPDLEFTEGMRHLYRHIMRMLQDVKDGKHRGEKHG